MMNQWDASQGVASPQYQPGQLPLTTDQQLSALTQYAQQVAPAPVQPVQQTPLQAYSQSVLPDGTQLSDDASAGYGSPDGALQLQVNPQPQQAVDPASQDQTNAALLQVYQQQQQAAQQKQAMDDGPGWVVRAMTFAKGGPEALQKLDNQQVMRHTSDPEDYYNKTGDIDGAIKLQALHTAMQKPTAVPQTELGKLSYDEATGAIDHDTASAMRNKLTGAIGAGPGSALIDPALTGQDAIDAFKAVNPSIARQAQAIVNLQQPLPPSTSRGPQAGFNQAVREAVTQIDPTYDAKSYATAQGVQKQASGSGQLSVKAMALNNMIEHLKNAHDNLAGQNNTGAPIINAPINAIERNIGIGAGANSGTTDLQIGDAIGEHGKLYGDNALADRLGLKEKLNSAQPLGQFDSNAGGLIKDAAAQLQQLQGAIKQGTGKFSPDVSILKPENLKAAKEIFGIDLDDPGTFDGKNLLPGVASVPESPVALPPLDAIQAEKARRAALRKAG